jgi:hypothetical protein
MADKNNPARPMPTPKHLFTSGMLSLIAGFVVILLLRNALYAILGFGLIILGFFTITINKRIEGREPQNHND